MSGKGKTAGGAGLSPRALILFCGFMTTISAFSTDAMLPAFLSMSENLDAPIPLVQATIPVFIIAYAVAQIFFGPLSDRFGRRPVITAGMVIFLLGAMLAALGTNIWLVLAGRAIQGFGAAAGPVLARAIMRDTYSGNALAQANAVTAAIFAVGPIFAPLVGYGIDATLGWRFIFVAMAALAFALLLVNLFRLQETNTSPDPDALAVRSMLGAFGQVLTNFQSRRFLFLVTSAFCALLCFISNAPTIYKSAFDVDGLEFAILFCATGFGIIVGQIVNRRILPVMGILQVLRLAGFIIFIASISSTILAATGHLTAGIFTALMFIFNTSFLVVVSNSMTLIIDPHPKIAGAVSAFFGFVTSGSAALFAILTVGIFSGDAVMWGIGMAVTTGITFAGLLLTPQSKVSFHEN